MREDFKGFYIPNDESISLALSGEDVLVVFDTNVLLNLYSYEQKTRDDFFSLLTKLGSKIWLPHHVCLEYHRRRLDVVQNGKKVFNEMRGQIKTLSEQKETACKNLHRLGSKKKFPDFYEKTSIFKEELENLIERYKVEIDLLDKDQPCVRSRDEILEEITSIFDQKTGSPYNDGTLKEIYDDGERRYKNKIPPGFQDSGKAGSNESQFHFNGIAYERQYGDLIIWKQIIEQSKKNSYKKVFFVTDDSKEDWWIVKDSNGKKNIGAHPDLVSEISREADVDFFYICSTSDFLSLGKSVLHISTIDDSSINDAEELFSRERRLESDFIRHSKSIESEWDKAEDSFDEKTASDDPDLARFLRNKRKSRQEAEASQLERVSAQRWLAEMYASSSEVQEVINQARAISQLDPRLEETIKLAQTGLGLDIERIKQAQAALAASQLSPRLEEMMKAQTGLSPDIERIKQAQAAALAASQLSPKLQEIIKKIATQSRVNPSLFD